MADDQDWRLRADIADAPGLLGRLRDAHHYERELEPLISPDVVLSADDDRLFAYANTRAAIDEARRALEHQLGEEGATATITVSHWDDTGNDWHQVEPAPDVQELARETGNDRAEDEERQREARVETRTVAVTSGRMVRNWFESTVADEARELGVELSIVEHPHLLSTQLAFTLTGPTGKVEQVIAGIQARAGAHHAARDRLSHAHLIRWRREPTTPAELVLRGSRISLRLPRAGDAHRLFELASDPEVTRFFSWGPYEHEEQAADWLATLPARRAERGRARAGRRRPRRLADRDHRRPRGLAPGPPRGGGNLARLGLLGYGRERREQGARRPSRLRAPAHGASRARGRTCATRARSVRWNGSASSARARCGPSIATTTSVAT